MISYGKYNSHDNYFLFFLIGSIFLFIIYGFLLLVAPVSWKIIGNKIGPFVLLVICLFGAYGALKNSVLALWTPIPWFMIACAAYFGFGAMINCFGSNESIDYVNNYFAVNESTLLRTNLLNVFSIAVVVVTYVVSRKFLFVGKPVRCGEIEYNRIRFLMIIMLVVGFLVKYLLSFPYYLGLFSWVLPGGIQYLSSFTKVSIILLFLLIYKGYKQYIWLLIFLIVIELLSGLMSFSKQAVIEVFLTIVLGWYLMRPMPYKIIACGIIVMFVYVFILSPFTSFARIAAGRMGVGTISEINKLLVEYTTFEKYDFADFLPGAQGWWARLNYSNVQAFAMEAYDQGDRGESIELIRYVFLPRLLFPDKPIMTPGRDFNELMTGKFTETATAPGFFAEAYWNGGWTLVLLLSLIIGVLFAGFAVFAEYVFNMSRYEYLPVVMIGIAVGYSPNDWFVATCVGSLVTAIVLYVIIKYFLNPIIAMSCGINKYFK